MFYDQIIILYPRIYTSIDNDKIESIVVKVIIEDIVSRSPPSCLDKIYAELAHGKQLNKIPTDFATPVIDIIHKIKKVIIGVIISFIKLAEIIIFIFSGLTLNFKLAPTINMPIVKAASDKLSIVFSIPKFKSISK